MDWEKKEASATFQTLNVIDDQLVVGGAVQFSVLATSPRHQRLHFVSRSSKKGGKRRDIFFP